ncbi:MAG: hypothetical protein FJ264_06140 [Planctomycetes bacterium]|nr:hypothetical protein [Planctomycetota bacterium]
MEYHGTQTFKDRRKKPDVWIRALQLFIIVSWVAAIGAIVVIGIASPKIETFFDRKLEVNLRKTWNTDVAKYFLYMMIAGLCASIFGIIINTRRHRRKSDQYYYSLMFFGLASIAGIILYCVYF